MENKGAMELLKTIRGVNLHPLLIPYDDEAEFLEALKTLEYIDPKDFNHENYGNNMKVRAQIRYLVCLFPYDTLNDATQKIYRLLNNKNIMLEDLRIIIDGRSIKNPQKRTREIPFYKLQAAGKLLMEGKMTSDIAEELDVARDTITSIENYLGLRESYRLKLIDRAIEAVRNTKSIREFIKEENVSFNTAVRSFRKAKEVLTELGETWIERKN